MSKLLTRELTTEEMKYEEINERPPLTTKPLYHFEMPSQYQHVFERPHMASTPAHSQSFRFVTETEREKEAPKSTEITPDTTSWSGLSFMGPRFPSLPPSPSDNHTPRIEERKLVEDLRQITEDELKTISHLEGDIHESIYGSRANQAPCSLLTDNQVVAASQCPSLLPGTLKDRIEIMHQVLDMMQQTKNHHIDTLKHLQGRGPQHTRQTHEHDDENGAGWDRHDDDDDEQGRNRFSKRLAGKSRHDYNQLNKRGFQEY